MTFTEFVTVANIHGWHTIHNNTRAPSVISQAVRSVKPDPWTVEYHAIGKFEGKAVIYRGGIAITQTQSIDQLSAHLADLKGAR